MAEQGQREDHYRDALGYAEAVIATVREPLVVLGGDLRVRTANRSFYRTFRATPQETAGQLLYDLGNRQWDIPKLRTLLEEILPHNTAFNDFEVEHDFPTIGPKVMLLNARRVYREGNHTELILLAVEDVTERRQAERAVREHRALLHATLSSVGDAVLTTDGSGNVAFLNPVAQDLTGWTQEQAAGRPLGDVFRIVNEFTRQAVENPAIRAFREGVVVGLANHTVLIARDGIERPIDDSAAPIRDDAGQVYGTVLVFRDVSERRRAERAADDARTYAEGIVGTVREPLVVLDGDLRVRTANRSFYAAFRVRPEDTEGRLLYDLGNRQWDIPALRTLLEDILPQNTAFNDFEVEHDFQDIGRKVMLLNARRLYREGNHTALILLAIEDVTTLREAERRRQEAEARFTEMVKNVRDHSIFLTDAEGVVTSWNVAAERIIGYAGAEAVGRHYSLIFTPEDIAAGVPREELRQARQEGRAEDERWHQRKDGTRFWAVGIVTPLHDPSGRLSGFSKILRDMTEWKQAHDRLEQQAVALREADHTKDEFLAMLAHE
jgi:PAS domain S-box-containing protein